MTQIEQRQGTVAHAYRQLSVDGVGARLVQVENFADTAQRQCKRLIAQFDHQGRHNRQRQRHADGQAAALAELALDLETAVVPLPP